MPDPRITELARILEGVPIEYCILHGWDADDSNLNSDVDIAVAPRDLGAFEKVLDKGSFGGIGQLLHYERTGYLFIVRLPTRYNTEFAKFDVGTDYRRDGLVYLSGTDLTRKRRKWHGVWIASPESEFAYLLVKRICNQCISVRQADRFHELHVELGERSFAVCRKLLGLLWAKRVVGWIGNSDWTAFEADSRRLRRALRWRRLISDPLNPLRYWLPEVMRLQRRLRYPTGLLVAVLGPDGAGKTTLIEGLRRELSETFRCVHTFRFRPDIFHRNLPGIEPHPHAKSLRSRWLSTLKVLYLWADYALGYLINVRSKLIRSDLVIFDRYYDDILVDPIRYRYGGPRWLIRFVRQIIPRPDITLILDASEDQMLTRKVELPREELRRQRIAYRQLAAETSNTVMLDASRPAAEVARQASECCLRFLHARYLKRRHLWFETRSNSASKGDQQQSASAEAHVDVSAIAEKGTTTTQARVFHQGDCPTMNKVLILDRRAAVMAMQVCRALARRGYVVDIFGESGSPAFHSRFCRGRLIAPGWDAKDRVAEAIRNIVEHGAYDAIYLCNEDILETIIPVLETASWRTLPSSAPSFLRLMMSKNQVLDLAQRSGVPVPTTIVPEGEEHLDVFARQLGMPLVIKGEKGESGANVRVVQRLTDVCAAYREVRASEASYGGRPALQAFVRGTAYSVGGLFQDGCPLRICAHRKILTYPPHGGWTVKGVTERPPGLLEEAYKVFAALKYTGLGHVEFVREGPDGEFKFLELNPRVWGSIGIARYAGVDLFSAYQRLAAGLPVAPDLSYRQGVEYHRFSGEARFILRRPQRIVGFAMDALNRNVHSDFDWSDLGPHFSRALVLGNVRRGSHRPNVQTTTPPPRFDLEGDNS